MEQGGERLARSVDKLARAEVPEPRRKPVKKKPPEPETTPVGMKVRADWTELCRVIGAAPRKRLARPSEVPKALRYLLDEPIRQVLFFLLDPARQRALEASGRDKGLPVRLTKKEVRLHRDWRWRLIAAGCDAAYPFATIGDSGSPWA